MALEFYEIKSLMTDLPRCNTWVLIRPSEGKYNRQLVRGKLKKQKITESRTNYYWEIEGEYVPAHVGDLWAKAKLEDVAPIPSLKFVTYDGTPATEPTRNKLLLCQIRCPSWRIRQETGRITPFFGYYHNDTWYLVTKPMYGVMFQLLPVSKLTVGDVWAELAEIIK